MKSNFVPLGNFIEEIRQRIGTEKKTVYSVTNNRGFVPSSEVFDKQVFSIDISNYKLVERNDLAYNPSRINVGSVAICPDENGGAVSPMYTVVRCKKELLPQYLLYFLRSEKGTSEINHRAEGAVRFQFKFKDMQRTPIYLPPLSEQERIVRLLDEATSLRVTRVRANARMEQFVPALFQEAFGDPPKTEFPVKTLHEVAEVVSGIAKGRKFDGQKPVTINYLRVANVQAGYLDLSEIKTIEALPSEVEGLQVRIGDVLLTEGGDFDKLGRGAMLEVDLPNCIHQNHVFRARVNQDYLLPIFFHDYLQTQQAKKYFLSCAKKTTNLASINLTQLRALPVPLPPLAIQREFAAQVGEARGVQSAQGRSAERIEALYQSMLSRAFAGELFFTTKKT